MRPELDHQCVVKASAQFWEQMLAMQLHHAEDRDICLGEQHAAGSVSLSGVWSGRIEVRMARALAIQATAAMLMQPIESVTETDTLDATKEITNMLGGVIKSSLPRPCSMTVPEAHIESGSFCHETERGDLLIVAFRHEAGDMLVRVWETAPESTAPQVPAA